MRLLGIIFLEAWTAVQGRTGQNQAVGHKHVNPFTCPFGGCRSYDEDGITVRSSDRPSELTKNFRLIIANEYGMAA